MKEYSLPGLVLAFCALLLMINTISTFSFRPTILRAHVPQGENQKHGRNSVTTTTADRDDSSRGISGLNLGAENYYHPQLFKVPTSAPILAQDPIGQWGDVMQRFTRELSTDTMEIANLDNEVTTYRQH